MVAAPAPSVSFRPDLRAAVRLAYEVKAQMQGPVRQALTEAHENMAEKIRDRAATNLKKSKSSRPQRKPSLMEEAIRDRQNSHVEFSGFQVGVEEWLNRSPAQLYWRRIEEGGPNPMARFGRITGQFFVEGGPFNPSPGEFGVHGRLPGWGQVRRGGFTVRAQDAAFRGYTPMQSAGDWFLGSNVVRSSYVTAFARHGIDFVDLYKLGYGVAPTASRLLAGTG